MTKLACSSPDQASALRAPAHSAIAQLVAAGAVAASPLGPESGWPGALKVLFSAILHSTLPTVIAWGERHTTLYNDAYVALLGDRHPAALGRPFDQVWADYRDNVMALLDEAYAGRSSYFDDVPYVIPKDGGTQEAWVSYSCSPAFDADGQVRGMIGTCIDRTANVRLARAQAQQADLVHGVLEQAPGLIVVLDGPEHRVRFTNRAYRAFIGGRDIIGQPIKEALPDLAAQGLGALIDEVYASGVPYVGSEAPVAVQVWPGGEVEQLYFDFTYQPIVGEDGRVGGIFSEGVDVTERVRRHQQERAAEGQIVQLADALRLTQHWLEQGMNAGKMVVWDFHPASGAIRYSDNAHEVLGYAHDRVERSFGHVHPEDLAPLKAALLDACVAGGQLRHTSRRIDPSTGQVKWIEQRGTVVSGRDEAVRMIGVNIDVTERVLAETALQDASRRKDEFLAMLAHELRNPLAPLGAAAHLLQQPGVTPAQIARTSTIVARQVGHMSKLLDDLLDVSRVTRGQVTLRLAPLDMKAVVASAIEQVQPLIDSRSHRLHTQLDVGTAQVMGDAVRLVQVLANLLNNACRYTAPGGDITLALELRPGEVAIRVSDNGAGIDAAFLPRIFELFTQGERSSDRSQGGLGLGLALVKTLVELHHGRVQAHSAGKGQGSSFELVLPRLAEAAGAQEAELRHEARGGQAERCLTIAVVDDNADGADMIAVALGMAGHRVHTFYDPLRFLDDARVAACDAFILDIGLPGMDGYQLARRLRGRPELAGAFIIALSGYGQQADVERAAAAGFDLHLTKPVSLASLQQHLASRLDARAAS